MAILHVERLGGLANFGGARSRVRSRGQIDTAALSAADRRAVDALFQSGGAGGNGGAADAFRYRISRATPAGTETVEAPEGHVPAALAACVKDDLA